MVPDVISMLLGSQAGRHSIKGADPEGSLKRSGDSPSACRHQTHLSFLPETIHPLILHQSSQKPQVHFHFMVSLTSHFINDHIPISISYKGQTRGSPVSSSLPFRMWSVSELSPWRAKQPSQGPSADWILSKSVNMRVAQWPTGNSCHSTASSPP